MERGYVIYGDNSDEDVKNFQTLQNFKAIQLLASPEDAQNFGNMPMLSLRDLKKEPLKGALSTLEFCIAKAILYDYPYTAETYMNYTIILLIDNIKNKHC